jgi:CO dehydrogenase/acetyl-CoA synthase gamma subunit (corrinoid Fe-S protein)
MSRVKYFFINVVETLLRFFPIPCPTGLMVIGNPGPNSPVFLTCNYHLTVQKVKKALDGIDCYLLV